MENFDSKSKEFLAGYKFGVNDALSEVSNMTSTYEKTIDLIREKLLTRRETVTKYINVYKNGKNSSNDFVSGGILYTSKELAEKNQMPMTSQTLVGAFPVKIETEISL